MSLNVQDISSKYDMAPLYRVSTLGIVQGGIPSHILYNKFISGQQITLNTSVTDYANEKIFLKN
jgi:hypothetical protein